ncbi:MAG: DISARM system phospholipase D-like protein DrmC [Candidatus Ozemobacteraceae bacterium]
MNPKIFAFAKKFIDGVPAGVAQEIIENLLSITFCGGLGGSVIQANSVNLEMVVNKVGHKVHPDHLHIFRSFLEVGSLECSPRELGIVLAASLAAVENKPQEPLAEIVWTGPETHQLGIRRNDQVLYDLIQAATREILLVTFSAAKIDLLRGVLQGALSRGIPLRLILEFEEASGGQLTKDAAKAFGPELLSKAEVYYWPLDRRECNQAGKPGKLHAKCALIDDALLVSSANLTDDAFNRNMELGVLLNSPSHAKLLRGHFTELISSGVIVRWQG